MTLPFRPSHLFFKWGGNGPWSYTYDGNGGDGGGQILNLVLVLLYRSRVELPSIEQSRVQRVQKGAPLSQKSYSDGASFFPTKELTHPFPPPEQSAPYFRRNCTFPHYLLPRRGG